jgi:hypothetical protein
MPITDLQTAANHNRRMANEARYLSRLERLEARADAMIGELTRDGRTVYYINLLNRAGNFTGKVKESASHTALADYLIRNKYL